MRMAADPRREARVRADTSILCQLHSLHKLTLSIQPRLSLACTSCRHVCRATPSSSDPNRGLVSRRMPLLSRRRMHRCVIGLYPRALSPVMLTHAYHASPHCTITCHVRHLQSPISTCTLRLNIGNLSILVAGASCPFSHTAREPGQTKPVCKWFQKG
jgi:hypothetical protein